MGVNDRILALRSLQEQIDKMREDLGISAPRSVLYWADLDSVSDEALIVEADGFGGATALIVEGNYPFDYLTTAERVFDSEKDAMNAADRIIEDNMSPDVVFEE